MLGDKKSAALIFGVAQKEGLMTPEQEEAAENFTETDAAVLDAYHQQLLGGQSEQSIGESMVEFDALAGEASEVADDRTRPGSAEDEKANTSGPRNQDEVVASCGE